MASIGGSIELSAHEIFRLTRFGQHDDPRRAYQKIIRY